ncbi:MAG: hypothetical protein HN494_04185 [Opitutae bacterium]|jgi:hypothetical protein|nr:hypothetical protein [Opitutae bacterium]MBT5910477.1 hypothetical protein [Opitutae bacterium]MBT7741877.1 hypothetical protein [Opitutae bacterium]MBT7923012.1 hypothetical protein [Opitutae bacterium]
MTNITISVPDDLPEGEKRRSIESEVETKLSKHEEEARLNDYLRDLYHKASKDTGKEIESTDDLIYHLARYASRDLKEKLIGVPRTVYPWQKPKV